MDLDVDIENITFLDVEVSSQENIEPVSTLMIKGRHFLMRKHLLYKMHLLIRNLRN
jgi:hypothetical protein